jgi:hypothetical protein
MIAVPLRTRRFGQAVPTGKEADMTRNVWLWVLAAELCCVAGCADVNATNGQAGNGEKPSRALIAKTTPPILDIPMPIGFELDATSRNSSGAGIRTVDHVYVGQADKFAVLRFYRRYMPDHGWKEMSFRYAHESGLVSFEKDVVGYKEECTVVVRDAGLWNKVKVQISVGPRGPASVPANPN